ncbi:hypothetical protein [Nostoc sp. DedSLP04]|nr:hypothetical protein [Nostoc sp. DedSLP04]MDZ8035244.1 hypothetical protein [Nostoc sp. DedSLP04]
MLLPSSVSNFRSFEEFKTFISSILVTAIARTPLALVKSRPQAGDR